MPARTKDTITAGPASGTAVPRITKIPVPTMDPTLNIVSASRPIDRFSSVCSPSAVISSAGLIRRNCRDKGMVLAMLPPTGGAHAPWSIR